MGYDPFTANLMLWGFAGFLLVMASLTAMALYLRALGITLGSDARQPGMHVSATFRYRLPAADRFGSGP